MNNLFHEIIESIRRNKLRTCLTGFAVTWGIFMLIVLLGAGNGLLNSFIFGENNLVTNTMTVGGGITSEPYAGFESGRYISLDEADMSFLPESDLSDYIDKVTTNATKGGYTLSYGRRYFNNVSLYGTFPSDAQMNGVKMITGRFINENDIKEKRKVIVLHQMFVRNFLSGGTDYDSILGKRVKVGNLSFQVIGVRFAEENMDDRSLYVPYSTMKSIYHLDDNLDQITFTFHGLETEEDNEIFETELRSMLNSRHMAAPDDKSATWISNRFTQFKQLNKVKALLQTALWVIGLLTLLSGIVGVSNIMLITVKERTHEFGIRKAIGAKPWSLIKLIISESVFITAIFGYIGMILGLFACEIMDRTVGQNDYSIFGESFKIFVNPTVGVGTAVGATIVLIVAGTIAGMVPAAKAARVKPIEALREE